MVMRLAATVFFLVGALALPPAASATEWKEIKCKGVAPAETECTQFFTVTSTSGSGWGQVFWPLHARVRGSITDSTGSEVWVFECEKAFVGGSYCQGSGRQPALGAAVFSVIVTGRDGLPPAGGWEFSYFTPS